ncbi:SRPBCC family protein [Phenylobacterium sp.]|uniref:SRPBCC family protein n=1 Tax=Phenylobacterium sp. TaxID=1871053 RepID=UPI0025FCA983|nr:SRPBCC family protein [Phenylobacterium sp.]
MTELKPPAGFIDTPHPPALGHDQLVTRVEEIVVERPLAQVMAAIAASEHADWIQEAGGLPGVKGTHVLTEHGAFDAPGSRHMVFLTDGSTIVEQVLEKVATPTEHRLRYVVWNYTSATAKPLRYGHAEFVYAALDERRTRIRWTYGFELRRDRFPGFLGPLGGPLLKAAFLNGPYAKWMRACLGHLKANAEAWKG